MKPKLKAPNETGLLSMIRYVLKIASILILLLIAVAVWYRFFHSRLMVIDRALLLPSWGVGYAYAISYFYTPFHLGPWWVPIRFVAETLLILFVLALDLGCVTWLFTTFRRKARGYGATPFFKHVLMWCCGLGALLFVWPAARGTLFFISGLVGWKPYGIKGVTNMLYSLQHLQGQFWGPPTHPLLMFFGIWFACVAGTVLLLWWPVRHLWRAIKRHG